MGRRGVVGSDEGGVTMPWPSRENAHTVYRCTLWTVALATVPHNETLPKNYSGD